ncbi:MAG: hypothetical protein HQL94_09005 [Magnetococcales bacterium]|nr:hypothetical protein [Magnetococcales bacterium]MBF0440108.1 hypothetical protein [Magnetococcales bacterium]
MYEVPGTSYRRSVFLSSLQSSNLSAESTITVYDTIICFTMGNSPE